MKKHPILIIGAAVLVLGVTMTLWILNVPVVQAPSPSPAACTREAKLCPDGSSVGRTGPNCEFTACPSTTTVSTTTTSMATLAIGASATIQGDVIRVRSLEEDSRCPVDVQCIQAGTVRVRASVNNSDFIFTLSQPQTVANATITLASVTPAQKRSTQTVQPSEYRFTFTVVPKAAAIPGGTVCTMEAKLCSDGSYVGRSGPNCEFAACPSSSSGVRGTVELGPTCPVERDPPDPQCADKPYATTISVRRGGSSAIVATGKSDASGAFQFSLSPGSYTLTATGGATFPRCSETNVTVTAGQYTTTTISCDTGIR